MRSSEGKRRKRLAYRSKSHTAVGIIVVDGRLPIVFANRSFSLYINRKKRRRSVVFCKITGVPS